MATLIPNKFSSYKLSEDELEAGLVLNTMQQQVIQNRISEFAELKLNLVFDPLNPNEFGLQVAYLAGKIDALNALVLDSDETSLAIQQRAAQSQSKE